ncbi:class-II fumarase/aspartase family protein [Amycolatopsis sacchari]|uniref:class-II fumarase/aspartase family protein n=1 Tax=Amycolatopsis sacchari TaxID=115433 RepID=UPI003D72B8A9
MSGRQHFTSSRVPDPGVRAVVATPNRWQRWLDVEAALALAQAELGMIPESAARAISASADLRRLDVRRIERRMAEMSHPLMPLIAELAEVVGEPHGGWVHWGATSQNIMQTGDVLVTRDVHRILLRSLARLLSVAAELADRGAEVVVAGRTHGQHAVPVTLGFKVAIWLDQFARHGTRLRRLEDDLLVAMVGGAAGTFASYGARGPELQRLVGRRLGLGSMALPARTIADPFAEYVCVLGLLAATGAAMAREVRTLMKPEFGEVREGAPPGSIGSSTMPHKRNPQLCDHVLTLSARLRALAAPALEAMVQDHEADGAQSALLDGIVADASVLGGDLLAYLVALVSGLEVDESRMRANLALTDGLINSEAVMLALGEKIGRQRAHGLVGEAAERASAREGRFADLLAQDPRIAPHLTPGEVKGLLDPGRYTGLSATLARQTAERARCAAAELTTEHEPAR